MAHSKRAVFIVLWMLLSLLNVLLHMRYNSNFHAPTAPNGCLMKRACVHKYEADGAQTTLFAISVNRILSSVLRMPERSSMYWILRGCGRMWANVGECGWMWLDVGVLGRWPLIAHSQSLESRDPASTCPMAKMIPMGGPLRPLQAYHPSKRPTLLARKLIKIVLASTYRASTPTDDNVGYKLAEHSRQNKGYTAKKSSKRR